MRGEDDHSVAAKFYKKISEPDPFPWIKTGSRLINNKNTGQMKKYLSYTHSLFHSPRVRAYFIMSAVLHMNSLQAICNSFFSYFSISDIFKHSLIMKIIMSCHVFIASKLLGKVSDEPLQLFSLFLSVQSIYPDLTVTLFKNATNYPHKCSFSCTIWPEKAKHTIADIH